MASCSMTLHIDRIRTKEVHESIPNSGRELLQLTAKHGLTAAMHGCLK